MSKPGIPTPIRRAQKGKPPTVEWAKWVEDEIRKLQSTGTPPLRQIASASDKPPFWTAISRVADSDPAEYEVTVTLGYLIYQSNTPAAQASELGTTGWIIPTIAGVSMEPPVPQTDPPTSIPKLPLPDVESWVYLRVKTDTDGFPKPFSQEDGSFVTIEAFNQEQKSIHHIRLSPESKEEEGDYFFLILKTKADESDPPRPIPERRITGNREMPNQMIEFLNLGEEDEEGRQEIYKGYDKAIDKHDLRAVLQLQTPGVAIIEPLAAAVDAVPPVVVDGTVVTPGTPAVPAEEPGDYIRWRTVSERQTNPQIKVVEKQSGELADGEKRGYIEITGNDYTNFLGEQFITLLETKDGLVTEFTGTPFGLDRTIRVPDECGTLIQILTFEKGLLTAVEFEAVVS